MFYNSLHMHYVYLFLYMFGVWLQVICLFKCFVSDYMISFWLHVICQITCPLSYKFFLQFHVLCLITRSLYDCILCFWLHILFIGFWLADYILSVWIYVLINCFCLIACYVYNSMISMSDIFYLDFVCECLKIKHHQSKLNQTN